MRNVDAAGSRAWHDGLAALHRYVEVGHTAAPPTSARVEGFALGEWVKQLRSCYWTGTLEPDRVELLEALPGWRWSGTHERQWRARLDALRRYAARNGTSAVPPGVVVGSRMRLGQWVAAQKASQAAGTLPRPAAELLEQVPGWEWEEQSQPEEETTRWTIVLDALRRRYGATGDRQVLDRASAEEFPLNQWIRRLRDDFRDGTLPPEVVAQLETLPGWSWDPGQTSWERGLYALHAWVSVHGDRVPAAGRGYRRLSDRALGARPAARAPRRPSWLHRRPRRSRRFPGGSGTSIDASWQRAVARAAGLRGRARDSPGFRPGHAVGTCAGRMGGPPASVAPEGQLAADRVAQLEHFRVGVGCSARSIRHLVSPPLEGRCRLYTPRPARRGRRGSRTPRGSQCPARAARPTGRAQWRSKRVRTAIR